MSVDQMLACSDASDSEAECMVLPYSDSLGGCPYSEGVFQPRAGAALRTGTDRCSPTM